MNNQSPWYGYNPNFLSELALCPSIGLAGCSATGGDRIGSKSKRYQYALDKLTAGNEKLMQHPKVIAAFKAGQDLGVKRKSAMLGGSLDQFMCSGFFEPLADAIIDTGTDALCEVAANAFLVGLGTVCEACIPEEAIAEPGVSLGCSLVGAGVADLTAKDLAVKMAASVGLNCD